MVHEPGWAGDAEATAVEMEENWELLVGVVEVGRDVEAEGGVDVDEVMDGEAVPRGVVGKDGFHERKGLRRTCPCAVDGAIVEDTEPAGYLVDDDFLGFGAL